MHISPVTFAEAVDYCRAHPRLTARAETLFVRVLQATELAYRFKQDPASVTVKEAEDAAKALEQAEAEVATHLGNSSAIIEAAYSFAVSVEQWQDDRAAGFHDDFDENEADRLREERPSRVSMMGELVAGVCIVVGGAFLVGAYSLI